MSQTKPCSLCGSRWAHTRKCPRAPVPVPCKECGVPKILRARGLCRACYDIERKREAAEEPAKEPELTDEELDAVIAERMKDLPEWWEKEAAGQRSERAAAAVVRERGLVVMTGIS